MPPPQPSSRMLLLWDILFFFHSWLRSLSFSLLEITWPRGMTNLNPRAELLAVYPHHQQIQGKGSRRSPPPRAAWEPVAACDFNKLHLTRSSVVCLLGGHERSWLFWTFCGTATARSQKQMVSSSESQSSPQFCSQKAAILLKYSQGSKSYLSRKLQS